MRGRRPEPAALKAAKGNPGRRPIVDEGTAPALSDDVLGLAPSWVGERGREVWARLAPDLAQMRLLARPDVLTFGRYCNWFALWLRANEALAEADLVVTTSSDHVEMDRLNKHLQAALLIEKRLVDTEDRFGLNPANRQRIFAQRAVASAVGPLFGERPSAAPTETPQAPPASPVGLLN